jgi:hypothetical protein
MSLNKRNFGLSCGAMGLFALLCGSTFAADGRLPSETGQWMARDNCVESTTGCVKIGGHVRVEFAAHGFSYYQYTSRATETAIRTDNLAGAASGFAEPRHLRVGTDDPYGYDPFVAPTSSAGQTSQ